MTLPFRRTLADREDVLGGAMLAPALAYVILLVGVPFAFAIALAIPEGETHEFAVPRRALRYFDAETGLRRKP